MRGIIGGFSSCAVAVSAGLALIAATLTGVAPASAASAPVTLPDMQVSVPTNQISIGNDSGTGDRMLRFTHITWDAGTGPFEIDPSYDSATGTASFVQSIYNSPSAGAWNLDHTVPLATVGVFDQPSDYQFPLTSFALYHRNADGSLGALAASSPKKDYCITADTYVGTVPNTPSSSFIPQGNCSDPTKALGWSVGWGDQYDQTDSGQPIDLTGVPDGSYVLRGIADPQHVLTESDTTNNVTDTVLTIGGTSVTIGAQSQPAITPPSVSVTSPAANASVSGTVNLTATAAGASGASIASVQFLLDGHSLGSPVTSAPYQYAWTVGSVTPGRHELSARATDSNGTMNTAASVPVTVTSGAGPNIDQSVNITGVGTVTTPVFSTSAANEVLLAEVSSDGPGGSAQTATVSGGGLRWKLVKRSDNQPGDAEIWAASTASVLSNVAVTSTPGVSGYGQQLSVQSYGNASGVGVSGVASANTGAPSLSMTSSAAGSVAIGVGYDWDNATARTLGGNQLMLGQWLDQASGDTMWAQQTINASTAAGQTMTISDTAPTGDRWDLAAVELEASTGPQPPDTTPPTVSITNPTAGETVSGTIPVAANATDNVAVAQVQFQLDGKPLGQPVTGSPYTISWDTTTATAGSHTLSAVATDTSGNTGASANVSVTVQNPAPPMTCFVQQAEVHVNGTGKLTTASFHTAAANETLMAFVSLDGPAGAGQQSTTVSGSGLTWKLVDRANGQSGDAEIWAATAPSVLTAATVTSTPAKGGFEQQLTVVAYEGASGTGATLVGSAAGGAPMLSVTTTSAASLVFAVGHDWDNATARTLPTGDVILEQLLDTTAGDTFWSEYTNQTTGAKGTVVKIGASAPTTDQWNMAVVELVNSGS